jgi:hypothetical protein
MFQKSAVLDGLGLFSWSLSLSFGFSISSLGGPLLGACRQTLMA